MTKKLISMLVALVGVISAYADRLPQVSTDAQTFWYLIQFSNGGDVFTASSNQAEISIAKATGTDDQFWKVTGDSEKGYVLTNKKGLTLYTDNVSKGAKIKAAQNVNANQTFRFVPTQVGNYPGDYEIQPMTDGSIAMNLFGGPGANNGVGFWSISDPNNCVKFVSEKDFLSVGKYAIIPYPSQLKELKEGGLKVAQLKRIECADQGMDEHLQAFAQQLKTTSGIALEVGQGKGKAAGTILMTVDSSLAPEGYTLKVNDNGIEITASQTAGFFYALQTLKQLLPQAFFGKTLNKQADWSVPFLEIADAPQMGHRGYMLDVARHFFSKEEVMRVLDIMSFYKLNRFHWHLTDDQGWRIEIPEYPKLTEVGSIRKGSFSNPGEGKKFFDDTEYGRGMWYSKKDLKEVVAYAKARNIEIIPEVDFPGHMVAAVTAYPELSCDPSKTYEVRVDAGISKDVLNIGNDKVIDFLKCIIDNLADVFPYPYIHFGGDECPTDQWQNNEDCLRRVQEKHLSGVNQLQSWLVEELGTYVKTKYNKDIMVWDELLNHWNSNNKIKPVIMAWNNIDKGRIAADKGLKSISCPHHTLYFDMMQVNKNKTLVDEIYYGGWNDDKVVSVEDVFNTNPTAALNGRENFCMGVQGNMWTETTNNKEELEYQMLPRLLALSETGWIKAQNKDWNSFYRRLQSHDEILDLMDYTYAKHYIVPASLDDREKALETAESWLKESVRGGVGYPSVEIYDGLEKAVQAAQGDATAETLTALEEAIRAYQEAPIVQPQPGKMYQIVSASTYYKQQYAGSSLYETENGLRIHYTPQIEPEELWQFVPAEQGFYLQNLQSGKQTQMLKMNQPVSLNENQGTLIRVDKATVATRDYSYIPGVVTISEVSGYQPTVNQKVKRFVADLSGDVLAKDMVALCYPGTWKIVEVTDFNSQLQGLCNKCEKIFKAIIPGKIGQPTSEATDLLKNDILTPAYKALEGSVTEDVFKKYLNLYNQFMAMPRISFAGAVNESVYYLIQNAYFQSHYAKVNPSSKKVEVRNLDKTDEAFYWQIIKLDNNEIAFVNKATKTYAYTTSHNINTHVRTQDKQTPSSAWIVENVTTDQNQSGLAILETNGINGWYANPDASPIVVLKPKTWGASIWNFIMTDQVVTDIAEVVSGNKHSAYYDLNGRHVNQPQHGVYIKDNGNKVLLP